MAIPTTIQGSRAEILLYEEIGVDFFGEGVGAAELINVLASLPDEVTALDVRINSPGGSLVEGTAMYNALARDSREVVTHIDGLAASAASLIAMAGQEIHIAASAMLMVHNASAITVGTADDHEATASVLRKWSGSMAGVYARRSGKDIAAVQSLMDAETWMTADEALAEGFATEVADGAQVAASWGEGGRRLVASFSHAPRRFKSGEQPAPKLHIAAQAKGQPMNEETRKKICARLGLPEDAKDETILAALEVTSGGEGEPQPDGAKPAAAAATPDLESWVPRAEFDAVCERLQAVESTSKSRQVDDLLRKHEGRIQSPDYKAVLREQLTSGALTFEAFEKLMEATPESRLTKPDLTASDSDSKSVRAAAEALGLGDYEIDYCEKRGMDPAAFAERKQKHQKRRELKLITG